MFLQKFEIKDAYIYFEIPRGAENSRTISTLIPRHADAARARVREFSRGDHN